ncbi:MAG TPA: twin-arginine translocation signal domain-containing protein, partial [Polyangiaceae bacterium]|nr:twin-arginine translocation signal domain-containing protein [Polyangiaceae bacterium]
MVAPDTNPGHETVCSSPASSGRGRDQDDGTSRRQFLGGAAAASAAATLLSSSPARARTQPTLAAQPPAGFVPLSAPGRVVKVTKSGCLEANRLFPKADDAKEMLRRALEELTGKSDLAEAAKSFVHPEDKVCVKVNGIAT